ncbi:6755_t:CDS:2 [Dentiscutata heterogama]|uniref:6755_t:CDS:1 n=1 Tax=Dentiscutata heterogama TaxID=1316150 RepID=A0ACA9JWQ9_9GLOM|nr:6755_t:CDS:2 [Dentiscutata heterogama]
MEDSVQISKNKAEEKIIQEQIQKQYAIIKNILKKVTLENENIWKIKIPKSSLIYKNNIQETLKEAQESCCRNIKI